MKKLHTILSKYLKILQGELLAWLILAVVAVIANIATLIF